MADPDQTARETAAEPDTGSATSATENAAAAPGQRTAATAADPTPDGATPPASAAADATRPTATRPAATSSAPVDPPPAGGAAPAASPVRPDGEVPTLSAGETAAVVGEVLAPLLARGVIVRRPKVVGLADRMDVDEKAVGRLRELRATYGEGPVRLRIPGRELAIVLSAADVHRVLDDTPDPFSPANLEKRFALRHFEPHVSLISEGSERADRRRFNEQVLETPRAVHSLAPAFVAKIREECDELLEVVRQHGGRLRWEDYNDAWHRIVRRIVLGDAGRDDHALTDLLEDLRRRANLSFLAPRDRQTRRRFFRQLHGHLRRAEPGSLAGAIASTPTTEDTQPDHQVPQWLFAFDAAGWASYRALALLAVHHDDRASIREGLEQLDLSGPNHLEDLRATVLESLRLWPTTPAILRDTTRETTWANGTLPAGAGVLVFAPLFHRDETRIADAHRFAPQLWRDGRGREDWPLVPFSGGPGECPAKDLVLFVTSTLLACLLERTDVELRETDRIGQAGELSATLSPFHLTFDLHPAAPGATAPRTATPGATTASSTTTSTG